MNAVPVTILLIEDDPGHARLIEKNVRRAGVANEIVHIVDGTTALSHLFGRGEASKTDQMLVLQQTDTISISPLSTVQYTYTLQPQ